MEDDWHVKYQDSHRADGLVLLGYGDYTAYKPKLDQLAKQGTHYARWGSVSLDSSGATVGTDNYDAGRQVGEHLLGLGRREIVFLGEADETCPEFLGRYSGLCNKLEAAGMPRPARFDAITTEQSGYAAVRALLASDADCDAIFAASDLIAIGAMRGLAEAGIRVPEDIAVVGFDDIPAASLTTPPLTTVIQDVKGAGETLVDALLAQIDEREAPARKLPGKLVVRGSTVTA